MKSLFALVSTTLLFSNIALSTAQAARRMNRPVPAGEVLFDDGEVQDLRDDKRFKITDDVVETFKVPRGCHGSPAFAADEKVQMVSIAIIVDTYTGKVYHENTTFRHVDDGDNTVGWIEEVNDAAKHDGGIEGEGRVVAVISDSFLGACK